MIANNEISALLSAEHWTWAKTMPGVPHEYIVRGRCRMTDAQFEAVVRLQREIGTHEVWGRYNFPYLYVDGYKYWTMGDPIPDTIILNRQKVFSEFDTLSDEVLSRQEICEGLSRKVIACKYKIDVLTALSYWMHNLEAKSLAIFWWSRVNCLALWINN